MPGWRDEYVQSLQEAERNNPVNKDLVTACSQLADRLAAAEAEKALLESKVAQNQSTSTPIKSTPTPETATGADPGSAQLRFDLAEALRSKGQLQTRLKTSEDELHRLRAKTKVDTKRIHDLSAERTSLASKLRDRSEELVGKNKLLKDVQDELLTLNIQLDVTEQQKAKVQAENKELIDRWMKRMGQEADALNLENEPLFDKR